MEPLAQALADTVERAVRLQTAARGDGRAGGDDLQQQDVPDGVPLSEDFGEDFGAYPASGIGPVWSDDNDRRPDVTQAASALFDQTSDSAAVEPPAVEKFPFESTEEGRVGQESVRPV